MKTKKQKFSWLILNEPGVLRVTRFLSPVSCRFRRWAMPPRPRSSATTPATTSSPGWCPQTHTRPRPWWTLSKPCAGTTSPLWPQRETTGRAAWMPSSRSPEKTVSISLNFDRFHSFIIISLKCFRVFVSQSGCFCHLTGPAALIRL